MYLSFDKYRCKIHPRIKGKGRIYCSYENNKKVEMIRTREENKGSLSSRHGHAHKSRGGTLFKPENAVQFSYPLSVF